jgi:hypothetical protein
MIYGMALGIAIINVVLKFILRLLSKFEKMHTKTEEISSSTIKMFVVQLINTGIIITLVNADFAISKHIPNSFPILNGYYSDFNIEWYKNVGTTISLTMIFTVFTPHIGNFLFMALRGCRNCTDRGCSCDRKKTSKLLQEDYDELYIGPEFLMEFRYSQLLTNIFMTFIYSTGMPALYFVCFISFCLTFWVDKYLFLRVYRIPPRYDITLIRSVRKTLKYAIILHFCIGFYMISNTNILTYTGDISFLSTFQDQVDELQSYLKDNDYVYPERLLTTHCLIYLFGTTTIFLFMFLLKACKKPM